MPQTIKVSLETASSFHVSLSFFPSPSSPPHNISSSIPSKSPHSVSSSLSFYSPTLAPVRSPRLRNPTLFIQPDLWRFTDLQ